MPELDRYCHAVYSTEDLPTTGGMRLPPMVSMSDDRGYMYTRSCTVDELAVRSLSAYERIVA